MHKFFSLKPIWAFAIFVFLDVICVGLGMGIPIFCILLGFPVGWYTAKRIVVYSNDAINILSLTLLGAVLTSAVTFVGMTLIWGPSATMLFDPAADLANFGIPQILYEPMASFIGWLVLMIGISPFLQFLMTLFGAHVTLWVWFSWKEKPAAL